MRVSRYRSVHYQRASCFAVLGAARVAQVPVLEAEPAVPLTLAARILIAGALTLCCAAHAQPGALSYKVGSTMISETDSVIAIASVPPQQSAMHMPGQEWPPIRLDEAGHIVVGRATINAATGHAQLAPARRGAVLYPYGLSVTPAGTHFIFARGAQRCRLASRAFGLMKGRSAADSLRFRNLQIATSDRKVMALAAVLGHEKEDTRYVVGEIDLRTCRFASDTRLGNPDLLVELGWSRRGGWWIAGSIEQTLLRSTDGKRWRPLPLPSDIFSIVSAYAVSKDEIWLAAGLAGRDNPYLLTYSTDGGKTWAALRHNEPSAAPPRAWLEGYRRMAQAALEAATGTAPD